MSAHYDQPILDDFIRNKILAVTLYGNNRAQSIAYFRVCVGLYYLSKIMVEEELNFKRIDREFNVFIYRTIGKGHSITSILQYLSSKKVLAVLNSDVFISTLFIYFSDIPLKNIPMLLSINLSVSKKISGLGTAGPVHDWIQSHEGFH
ncbi:MAG: hypothetical protein V4805_16610 [Pseudomonadota bacterium]